MSEAEDAPLTGQKLDNILDTWESTRWHVAGVRPPNMVTDLRISWLVAEVRRLRETEKAALEVIYASDGCQGHRGCNHSMDPWRHLRAALGMDACGPMVRWGTKPPAELP